MATGVVHRCIESTGESKTGINIGTVLRTIKETMGNHPKVGDGMMRSPPNP